MQALVNDSYLSPQLRRLELFPAFSLNLYLETPTLTIKEDGGPLAFEFRGKFDADFLGSDIAEPVGLLIKGRANLHYRPEDHGFYLVDLALEEASIDLELLLVQALVMDSLRKALSEDLLLLPVISLKEGSPLYEKLGQNEVMVEVREGRLALEPVPAG